MNFWLKKLIKVWLFGLLSAFLGCSTIAQWAAPDKVPATQDPQHLATLEADFWQAFHSGQFFRIQEFLDRYKVLYINHNNHPKIAARIGFLHVWRLSERHRAVSLSPSAIDDATLCKTYFGIAHQLQPNEARYFGFWASCVMAEANIHKNERELRRGYFLMKDAVEDWPEFNLFTSGYVMSHLPVEQDQFREAVDQQWDNLDVCVGTEVHRDHLDYRPYMKLATKSGPKRACWNSWIAPHNFEGFFLNFGDMLVKQGNVTQAKIVYNQAKLSPDYSKWPYRNILEQRIKSAEHNVKAFRKQWNGGEKPGEPTLMFNSIYSCMACHQAI